MTFLQWIHRLPSLLRARPSTDGAGRGTAERLTTGGRAEMTPARPRRSRSAGAAGRGDRPNPAAIAPGRTIDLFTYLAEMPAARLGLAEPPSGIEQDRMQL
jgi:hypothetical protein